MTDNVMNVSGFNNSLLNKPGLQKSGHEDVWSGVVSDSFRSTAESGFSRMTSLMDIGSIFGKPDEKKAILENAFKMAEETIAKSASSDIQKSASKIVKDLFGKIGEYAKATGKEAGEIANDVKDYALSHPAVSITLLLATGVSIGVLLEKYNVPSSLLGGATTSLSAIQEQIKNHPFIATGIGMALAGTIGYLVNFVLTSPAMKHPSADTPEKQILDSSLDTLEQVAAESVTGNPREASKNISEKFFATVSDYAKAAGKSMSEAAEDVKSFMMAHPGVTASVILAAGTSTGIILQKAGVPDSIALLAGSAFDVVSSKVESGLSGLTETIKENPVVTAVVLTAIASGAGYLAYEYLSKNQ